MKTLIFAAVLVGLTVLSGAVSADASPLKMTSKYTSLEDNGCKMIDASSMHPNSEIDYFKSTCPGLDGTTVIYAGGDIRSWIGLIEPGKTYEEGVHFYDLINGDYGQFPNIGALHVEWRYSGAELVAMIVRVNGQDPDDHKKDVEHLVVLRIDRKNLQKTCAIGAVNVRAVKKSNEAARVIADDLSKQCP